MSAHNRHKHSTHSTPESGSGVVVPKPSVLARLFANFEARKAKERAKAQQDKLQQKPVLIATPTVATTAVVTKSGTATASTATMPKQQPAAISGSLKSDLTPAAPSNPSISTKSESSESIKSSKNSFKELFTKKFKFSKPANVASMPVNVEATKTNFKQETPKETPKVASNSEQKPVTKPVSKKYLNLFNPHKKLQKKTAKKLTKTSLQEYLDKAGFEVSSDVVRKLVFRYILITFLVVSLVILVLASIYGAQTHDIIIFMLGLWTVVFAGIVLLAMACVYFYLDYRIYSRTKEIEEVFPDFLQLASSNISAGMPVDKALWYAIRPNFGVLAKEMEEVAKATMTGEDLEVSLLRFANKYNSQTIRRSINILIEGMRSGGEMADLLNKIALNIDEMKLMKKEMAANVMTYAIFISFAAVVIAPFLFALATELLTIIIKISGSLSLSSSGSFSFKPPSESSIAAFKIFSVITLIVTAVFSVAIVSVIRHGRVMEGIKSMPFYALVSVVIYYVALSVMHGVFGSII